MVNCNPETVSTDYDTSDRLYFEPLTAEDVIEIVRKEEESGEVLGLILQYGGQTPLKLAADLEAAGVPVLGTTPDAIDLAEDRERFQALLQQLDLRQPANGIARTGDEAVRVATEIGYPVVIRPSYVLGGRAMEIVHGRGRVDPLHHQRGAGFRRQSGTDRFLPARRHRGRCRCHPRRRRRRAYRGHHGTYRGSRHSFRRFRLFAAALFPAGRHSGRATAPDGGAGPRAGRGRADERAVRDQGRDRLHPGGQSAGQSHGAVRREGNRRAHCKSGGAGRWQAKNSPTC